MANRTVIVGGPRTGKTTRALAEADGAAVIHTDHEILARDFAAQSEAVAHLLDQQSSFVMEGVTAVRALRKCMRAHPDKKPCDRVIRLTEPHQPLTPGQASLAKGCDTVWREIEPELRRRGVVIE